MLGHRQLTMDDCLAILRRWWWVLITPAVLGAGTSYLISLKVPNRYTSQTLVLVEQPTVPVNYVMPVVTQDLKARLATMQEQILSRARLQPIVEKLDLDKEASGPMPMDEMVDRLRKSISVTPVQPMPGTQSNELNGFYVAVTLSNPRLAQQVCTEVTSMFMEENLRLRQKLSQDTTQFLASQLDEAKAKLDEQDAKLAAFKRRHIGELPSEEETNLNLLMSTNTQLEAVTQVLSRARQDKSFVESLLVQQVTAWKTSQEGHSPQTLEQQLISLQNLLVALRAHYTDDYPDVVNTKNDIAQLQKKIEETSSERGKPNDTSSRVPLPEPPQIQQLRNQIYEYEQTIREKVRQEERLQQQMETLQQRVQLSPSIEQEFKELTRDYQTALNFYNDLLLKREHSAMANDLERRQQSEQFRVLDPPSLPGKPSFPDRPRFATIGLGAGLALGLGLTLLLEARDKSLRTERDLEFFLEIPALAVIPAVETSVTKASDSARTGELSEARPGGA